MEGFWMLEYCLKWLSLIIFLEHLRSSPEKTINTIPPLFKNLYVCKKNTPPYEPSFSRPLQFNLPLFSQVCLLLCSIICLALYNHHQLYHFSTRLFLSHFSAIAQAPPSFWNALPPINLSAALLIPQRII